MSNCPKCGVDFPKHKCQTPKDCWFTQIAEVPGLPKGTPTDIKSVKHPKKRYFKPKDKKMKKIIKAIRNTLSGENKAGELIHGVADLLPLPNQAIAKLFKALFSGNMDEAKAELPNIFTTRNIIAILASVAYFAGWITVEDVKNLITTLSEIL